MAAITGGAPLLDVHQVGLGETGNETWARNVVRVLEDDGGAEVGREVGQRGGDVVVEGLVGVGRLGRQLGARQPGRALVGPAAFTLYRVGAVKRAGERRRSVA